MADQGACLVIGAGDDTGAAIGRAFAREGLVSCLVRRERHADQLEALAQSIRDDGFEALAMPGELVLQHPTSATSSVGARSDRR